MTTNPEPRYCSHCGEAGWISEQSGHPHCSQCGTTHWTNDRPVAVMMLPVIGHDEEFPRFFLTTTSEAREDDWCFPAGFVEKGECAEEAARRELREETGIDYLGSITVTHTAATKRGHLLVFCQGDRAITRKEVNEQFTETPEARRWTTQARIDGFRHPLHREAFDRLSPPNMSR